MPPLLPSMVTSLRTPPLSHPPHSLSCLTPIPFSLSTPPLQLPPSTTIAAVLGLLHSLSHLKPSNLFLQASKVLSLSLSLSLSLFGNFFFPYFKIYLLKKKLLEMEKLIFIFIFVGNLIWVLNGTLLQIRLAWKKKILIFVGNLICNKIFCQLFSSSWSNLWSFTLFFFTYFPLICVMGLDFWIFFYLYLIIS